MRRVLIRGGDAFDIWAIDLGTDDAPNCPFKDFMGGLPAPVQKSIASVLSIHADHGPIMNEDKSRELDDGIYEFKTRQGARILFFYSGKAITVLTHGFKKGTNKKTAHEVDRAKALRADWRAMDWEEQKS